MPTKPSRSHVIRPRSDVPPAVLGPPAWAQAPPLTGLVAIAVLALSASAIAPVAVGAQVADPSSGAGASQPPADPTVSQLPRITVSWTEAPLRDVIQAFAAYSGRSIVLGTGAEEVFVTADIHDQPWDVALATILRSRGLWAVENEYGIIRVESLADVAAREALQPIVTRSYRISFSRAAELQSTIAPLLSERGSVSVVESSNVLVVSDIERVQRVVAGLLGG